MGNSASIALRFGFKRVAHYTEQGRKFGRYWDVAWFEKPIGGKSEIERMASTRNRLRPRAVLS